MGLKTAAPSLTRYSVLGRVLGQLGSSQHRGHSRRVLCLEYLSPEVLLPCLPTCSFEEMATERVRNPRSRCRLLGTPGRRLEGVQNRDMGTLVWCPWQLRNRTTAGLHHEA